MTISDSICLSNGLHVSVSKKNLSESEKQTQSHRPTIEKVNNVWGSTAGAGSDFFHIYRKHRAHEMDRLRSLDEDYERMEEEKQFQERREAFLRLDAERSAKRSAKRKIQKERQREAKSIKRLAKQMNTFKNDGSFLSEVLPENKFIEKDTVANTQGKAVADDENK